MREINQRVIKFRAWHTEAKQMLHVGDKHGTTHPLDCCAYAKSGQPVILMQFTGLYDSKGVEIYEGDILWQVGTEKDKAFAWYVVVWRNITAGWGTDPANKPTRESPTYRGGLNTPKKYEVIGNIYQNPELLKP